MSPVLLVVLQFAGRHWRALVLSAATCCAGVWVGRHSVTCPPPPPPTPCQVCKVAEVVECPKCSLDAGVTIRWLPSPTPPTPGCPAPPPVPEVTVQVSEEASGGSTKAVAQTALPPPPDAPKAQPRPAQDLLGPHWEVGAGAGVSFGGNLAIPAEVQWNPWGLPIGFEVLVVAVPAAPKGSSVSGLVKGRFP